MYGSITRFTNPIEMAPARVTGVAKQEERPWISCSKFVSLLVDGYCWGLHFRPVFAPLYSFAQAMRRATHN